MSKVDIVALKNQIKNGISEKTLPGSVTRGNVAVPIDNLVDTGVFDWSPDYAYTPTQKCFFTASGKTKLYECVAATAPGQSPALYPLKWRAITGDNLMNDPFYVGRFMTEEALNLAIPTGLFGQYANVAATNTIWIWDEVSEYWVNSGQPISVITLASDAEFDASNEAKAVSAAQVNQRGGNTIELIPATPDDAPDLPLTGGKTAPNPFLNWVISKIKLLTESLSLKPNSADVVFKGGEPQTVTSTITFTNRIRSATGAFLRHVATKYLNFNLITENETNNYAFDLKINSAGQAILVRTNVDTNATTEWVFPAANGQLALVGDIGNDYKGHYNDLAELEGEYPTAADGNSATTDNASDPDKVDLYYWKNGAWQLFSSGDAGATTLAALTDTNIPTPADKDILQYNSTSGKWVNAAISELTISGDFTIASDGTGTLANSGVTSGTYGGASFIPQFTVDAKGRVTGVTNIAVTTGGLNNPLAAGSASAPAVQIRATNTGYYSAAANEQNVSVSGGEIFKMNTTRIAHRPYNAANNAYATFQGYSAPSTTQHTTRVGSNVYFDPATNRNEKDVISIGGVQTYFLTSSTATGNAIGFAMAAPGGTAPYPTVDAWYCQMESSGTSVFSQFFGRVGIGIAPAANKYLHVYNAANVGARFESGASVAFDMVKGGATQFGGIDFYTTTTRHYYINHWNDNTLRAYREGAANAAWQINTDGTISFPQGISGSTTFSTATAGTYNLTQSNTATTGDTLSQFVQNAGTGAQGGLFTQATTYTSNGEAGRTTLFCSGASSTGVDIACYGSNPSSFRFIFTDASNVVWELFRAGHVFVKNTTGAPSGTPSGGGYLYVESGALKFKGSSGTITTIATA